tara:strand:- start:96 stop:845 length:750 start_codon:yes stop_codon:yes gene_type:complete
MSKLETNQVDPASGTTLTLGTSGDTVTVPTGVGLTATDEVKSNKLSPATGTALQIGDSGDTITIPSGATIVNSGTQTGFGGTNTPAFQAFLATAQTISDSTWTKIQFDDLTTDGSIFAYNEGGCYNNTGSTATLNGISVPSYSFAPNVAGKYRLNSFFTLDSADNNGQLFIGEILKNGNTSGGLMRFYSFKFATANTVERVGICMSAVVEANGTSDYFNCSGYAEVGSDAINVFGTNNFAGFSGERIII